MGKFNEYSQKATPADNDTLMIYDATAKTNKLSPFSGIWNWIVGKLTNAVISNLQTSNKTVVGALNELNSNSHLGKLNDNIAEYLSKTNSVATTYFVWGNIGGLYPSWAWGTLLCSTDNTANFIGIANSDKTAAFAHYENGTWEKVPVESLSNLTTTNKSSLVDAINEVNSKKVGRNEIDTIYITDVEDLNNPPQAFIINTGIQPIGLPTQLNSNACLVIQHNPFNNLFTAQLAFSFGSDKIAIRRKLDTDSWTEWKYFTAQ